MKLSHQNIQIKENNNRILWVASLFYLYYVSEKMTVFSYIYFIQCEAWVKYCNRSRGKRDFKESSGKGYGTHGLN